MKFKIASGIQPGQEVWSGIPGMYLTAPEEQGTYTLYELAYEDENGNPVHDDFVFEKEGL